MKKQKQNTVLNMYGRSMVVPCLKIEMISPAYIMVNWLKHYGKRICSFVCVICAVICSYGNFFWVIVQLVFLSLIINGNTPLTKIFLFQILCFIIFHTKLFFLLQQHMEYLLYRFAQQFINCFTINIDL